MKVTADQIRKLVQAGDLITVEYLTPNLAQAGVQFFEKGRAAHVLCAMEDFDLVEADVLGVVRTHLYNYLKGQCVLTVRRPKTALTPLQINAIKLYWLARVNDPYDFGMILGMIPILTVKSLVGMFSKRAANWTVKNLGNWFGNHSINTCAELWVRGWRAAGIDVLHGYSPENVYPELLRLSYELQTSVVLVAPILEAQEAV